MSSGQSINALWLVAGVILAVSALSARRLSVGSVLRSILAWSIIAGVAWAAITHREMVESYINIAAEQLGVGSQTVEGETVRIGMAADGHFWARAKLNGVPKRLLIDSGATITAITPDTARAAGIKVGTAGFPVVITTANGTIAAQRGSIATVGIGGLETQDLGVVVSPAFGEVNVLGMNFLSRLGSWRVEGRTLILEPKRAPRAAPSSKSKRD